jgi:hypothetical protein
MDAVVESPETQDCNMNVVQADFSRRKNGTSYPSDGLAVAPFVRNQTHRPPYKSHNRGDTPDERQ